jgi:tight adherence protein C
MMDRYDPQLILISAAWAVAAAGLAWYCAQVASQITYVTLADGRRQERRLPLAFRLLLPLAPNVAPLFNRPLLAKARERTDRRLVAAGFEGLLSGAELLSLQILMPALYGVMWILFVLISVRAGRSPILDKLDVALYAIGPLWLCMYPSLWLRQALKRRHLSMRRRLPFLLDLLTLSVEAGMDFMNALQRAVERSTVDPLSEELIRVVRQIQLGKTRREALRDMSRRVDLADLRSVVNALVQADELGVSIGTILRIQSDQIRLRRFERAERLANEAPVKMLFPLLFFIFPAVFLILLGPIVVRLVQQGF